jgi:hypothetical protein
MRLTTKQVLALTEDTIRKFLSLAIPEGLYLITRKVRQEPQSE